LLGDRIAGFGAGLLWGALYGLAWWILGGLVLMPLFLGMSPFAPLMMEMMRPVAFGSLAGHALYGSVLGISFLFLSRNKREVPAAAA